MGTIAATELPWRGTLTLTGLPPPTHGPIIWRGSLVWCLPHSAPKLRICWGKLSYFLQCKWSVNVNNINESFKKNTFQVLKFRKSQKGIFASSISQRIETIFLNDFCRSFDPIPSSFNSLDKFEPIWSILIHFIQLWSILIQFEQVWTSLNNFEQVWSSLKKFDQFGSSVNQFDPFLSNLNKFGQVWTI